MCSLGLLRTTFSNLKVNFHNMSPYRVKSWYRKSKPFNKIYKFRIHWNYLIFSAYFRTVNEKFAINLSYSKNL